MSVLSDHWRALTGAVHPMDVPVFASHSHTFNLDFPPPAFVGDADAPIVILMANGGYKSGTTEAEFQTDDDVAQHLAYLRGDRRHMPDKLSNYYQRGTVGRWLRQGLAVSVNAVPYRSPRLSAEPHNYRVAKLLPSFKVHRKWLFEEVMPEAKAGRRYVFVHRNGLWQVPQASDIETVRFSDPARAEPNRAAPDQSKLEEAERWLRGRA